MAPGTPHTHDRFSDMQYIDFKNREVLHRVSIEYVHIRGIHAPSPGQDFGDVALDPMVFHQTFEIWRFPRDDSVCIQLEEWGGHLAGNTENHLFKWIERGVLPDWAAMDIKLGRLKMIRGMRYGNPELYVFRTYKDDKKRKKPLEKPPPDPAPVMEPTSPNYSPGR